MFTSKEYMTTLSTLFPTTYCTGTAICQGGAIIQM